MTGQETKRTIRRRAIATLAMLAQPEPVQRPGVRQEDVGRLQGARRKEAPGDDREMTREILEKAPSIWLPSPYYHTAWWPWVRNYGGELRAGAERPGPIHARIWVDQDLKKKMGF